MSSLNINIPHSLTKEEALSRIKGLLRQVKEEQANIVSNVKETWQDDKGEFSFSAMGFDLSGLIDVKDNGVDINANLPFALSLFSGKIKGVITQKATQLLS
ncbi:MAG: polyhydroxyalkanoic acid system family protein [Agriterribacter sp.]